MLARVRFPRDVIPWRLAEHTPPDKLAELLGAYLEAMTGAVRSTGGTIDKFIGDAVMALWNAPGVLADHPRQACLAVLACKRATRALYASPRWRGRPALVTRFGLHTDRVLVGHFGAPERMSYTALGDGVNLASRLEALGKQYGVTALVSEAVANAAGEGLRFRRIDRVAVKGKSAAVVVCELLDPEDPTPAITTVAAYEAALEEYFARKFEAAALRLAPQAENRRSLEVASRAVSPPDRRAAPGRVGRGLHRDLEMRSTVTGAEAARSCRRTRANERGSERQTQHPRKS